MDRRKFIAVTAITGASAALACAGHPENQLVRFIPDDELVPGVATWKPSICPLCAAGCGVIARVMEGDAEVFRDGQAGVVRMGLVKKLEGNPADPISGGRLCARGQAAVQLTYHPDRIGQPLRRVGPRGSAQYAPVSWDEALATLVEQLDGLAAAGRSSALGVLGRPRHGHRQTLVAEFARRFGARPPMTFEAFGDDVLRRANALSFGRSQLPTLDLAACRYLISFGTDFLGTWGSPVAQIAAYGDMRQARPGIRAKFVQIEPRMSLTGANADEWLPIRPGTDGVLALGLAHVMLQSGLRRAEAAGPAGALLDGWADGLGAFAPDRVEALTGVGAATVERLARELAAHVPGVAIIGGAPLAHTNGLFHALAVNALNALVGSVGVAGGIGFMPQVTGEGGVTGPWTDLLSPQDPPLQVLLLDEANPVFGSPPGWRVREALERVPFIASFGSFLDETSVLADLILPDSSFLESWVDAVPESGAAAAVVGLAPPAMRPLYDTRAMPDVLLDVARRLAQPLSPPLPWQTFEDLLRATVGGLPSAGAAGDAWTTARTRGGWSGAAPADAAARAASSAPRLDRPAAFEEPRFDGDPDEFPFHFAPYLSHAFLDGSLAHLPWLQELPDPLTTAMWSCWVELNPKTAERLQIRDGDLVEVTSQHGTLRAPALVSPGLAPDLVAMPVGQGHTTFTRYASGRGANPIAILAPLLESATGALAWGATRVRVVRVGDGRGDLILFAGATRERPYERTGR